MRPHRANVATIKFVEGFASALRDTDSLVVTFRDIPEGVTVTASMMGTGTALDMESPTLMRADLAPLTLVTAGEMSGLDEDGNVALSSSWHVGSDHIHFDDDDHDGDMIC